MPENATSILKQNHLFWKTQSHMVSKTKNTYIPIGKSERELRSHQVHLAIRSAHKIEKLINKMPDLLQKWKPPILDS